MFHGKTVALMTSVSTRNLSNFEGGGNSHPVQCSGGLGAWATLCKERGEAPVTGLCVGLRGGGGAGISSANRSQIPCTEGQDHQLANGV